MLSSIKGSSKTPFLYDDAGRVRLFHGVNSVNKGSPWFSNVLLNDTLLDEMKDLGVTAVRLGWMYTGFEGQSVSKSVLMHSCTCALMFVNCVKIFVL
jgi:hypothetical protein